jgi:hypothetical protein
MQLVIMDTQYPLTKCAKLYDVKIEQEADKIVTKPGFFKETLFISLTKNTW